ncbi:MAG: DNA mismatch repair endonuclease MutL [Chloroflexi bacterium]|nr:DNA mismatch repair endonuclease MutL [Chloroflexota bacterium]
MPIRSLPPQVVSRIAAGEVVERPASVVKELVENSLDAGATSVHVELKGGGLELIRVVDNGAGIPAAEVSLAFQRHATSKIQSEEDLESIGTLGFRGEALGSISAVARVTMITRTAEELQGSLVEVYQDRVLRQEPRGCPVGTVVGVHGLFQDLPARRKFMRSPQAEEARVHALVSTYSLAFPTVGFTLVAEGKEAFRSAAGSLREKVLAVWGPSLAANLVEVEGGEGGLTVQGFVSTPQEHRVNRSHQIFLVNRRPVRSALLSSALEGAYQGLLPERRHPVAVLSVALSPGEVDVNVHPTKAEVRFREESRAFTSVQRLVRRALAAYTPVPQVQQRHLYVPPRQGSDTSGVAPAAEAPALDAATGETQGRGAPTTRELLPRLRVLGQAQGTYIVAEGPGGVYLIDQHAAHERVLFEQFLDAMRSSAPQVQSLLEPAVVELSPAQAQLWEECRELVDRLGWQVEPFGQRSLLIRGRPAALRDADPARAFQEFLEGAATELALPSWEERLAATLACHSAVRAGDILSPPEMAQTARLLEGCRESHTCPHGRPTMVQLSTANLEREFRRR